MSLHPQAPRPEPELWRAVHEQTAALSSPFIRSFHSITTARAPHGMPADRLAMAASGFATGWLLRQRPA
jgi:hypothetical protein